MDREIIQCNATSNLSGFADYGLKVSVPFNFSPAWDGYAGVRIDLIEQARRALLESQLAGFIEEAAGTEIDLDPVLEAASIEVLLRNDPESE